jgi:hypothetical protein
MRSDSRTYPAEGRCGGLIHLPHQRGLISHDDRFADLRRPLDTPRSGSVPPPTSPRAKPPTTSSDACAPRSMRRILGHSMGAAIVEAFAGPDHHPACSAPPINAKAVVFDGAVRDVAVGRHSWPI